MPAIVIHSIEMTDEQKKIIADKFISTFSEVSGVPKDFLQRIWTERSRHRWQTVLRESSQERQSQVQ